MGVYHLMGLGTSAGAVTAPLSYLAHRYERWNADDVKFFGRSGEVNQREKGDKVGDVQALILFTTREVLCGDMLALPYLKNMPGNTNGALAERAPMKNVLMQLLANILSPVTKREQVDIFWCEIDRRDIRNVYDRVIQVAACLSGVGGQGKEMWANLTGGNNVTNLALELAATLSGQIARLYYVQAQNQDAEKCVFHSAEENYWVEMPAMPLSFSRLTYAILDMISLHGPLNQANLYSRLLQHKKYFGLVQGVSPEHFMDIYLTPMWKQGLLAGEKEYGLGPQWEITQPYVEKWQEEAQRNKNEVLTLEKLAAQEPWIERQSLMLER